MDLDQLRTFVAIAREGNLTRASKAINLSQPAVSGQLKALEEELRLTLFRRTARGMELTAAGESILVEAESALSAAGSLVLRARTLRDAAEENFRLGTIAEPTMLRLSQLLALMSKTHPTIRLNIVQGTSGIVMDKVKAGELDGGYVIGAVKESELEALEVSPITLRIVAPVSMQDRLVATSLADLSQLPWVSTPSNCSYSDIMNAMFAREGAKPRIAVEANSELTLRELVTSGFGLTLLREDLAIQGEAQGDYLVWKPLAEQSMLNFVFRKDRQDDPTISALVEDVRAVWGLAETAAPAA